MERKDIPQQLTWNTSALYENDEAWEQAFAAAEKEFSQIDFSAYSGKLADKQTLLSCFKMMDEVSYRVEKL